MLFPRVKTDPAKIELAFRTLHVVAAFILLNLGFAIRTRFAICHQPITVCGIFTVSASWSKFLWFDFGNFLQPTDPLLATWFKFHECHFCICIVWLFKQYNWPAGPCASPRHSQQKKCPFPQSTEWEAVGLRLKGDDRNVSSLGFLKQILVSKYSSEVKIKIE